MDEKSGTKKRKRTSAFERKLIEATNNRFFKLKYILLILLIPTLISFFISFPVIFSFVFLFGLLICGILIVIIDIFKKKYPYSYLSVLIIIIFAILLVTFFNPLMSLIIIILGLIFTFVFDYVEANKPNYIEITVKDDIGTPFEGIKIYSTNPDIPLIENEKETDYKGQCEIPYPEIGISEKTNNCNISVTNAKDYGYQNISKKIIIDTNKKITKCEFSLRKMSE